MTNGEETEVHDCGMLIDRDDRHWKADMEAKLILNFDNVEIFYLKTFLIVL